MIIIELSPTAALARAFKTDVTIEAEYGNEVIEGTIFTSAHHQKSGKYSKQHSPAPCNNPDIPYIQDGTILVGHIDLDSLAGCIRAYSRSELFAPEHKTFWALAEFVDLHGLHRLKEAGAFHEDVRALHAYFAAEKTFPKFPDDATSDIYNVVRRAHDLLDRILVKRDNGLLVHGDRFVANQAQINARTFRFFQSEKGIIGRIAANKSDACDHLFVSPKGQIAKAAVSLNEEDGTITISLAEPQDGISCIKIASEIWGADVRGNDMVATSPKGIRLVSMDWSLAISCIVDAMK